MIVVGTPINALNIDMMALEILLGDKHNLKAIGKHQQQPRIVAVPEITKERVKILIVSEII